jgi:hypothetical protein
MDLRRLGIGTLGNGMDKEMVVAFHTKSLLCFTEDLEFRKA